MVSLHIMLLYRTCHQVLLPDKAAAKGAFTFGKGAKCPKVPLPKVLLPFMTKQLLVLCMIKQEIDALRKAPQFLNSGQTPVMAFDAPLFALTKFIQ